MDEPVYKRPLTKTSNPVRYPLPSLEQVKMNQEKELLDLAQVRYGIRGTEVTLSFQPVGISVDMDENAIFRQLMTVPMHERADQVLYALATGQTNAAIANRVLASLSLIARMKDKEISNDHTK
jgi:hypothetical protein